MFLPRVWKAHGHQNKVVLIFTVLTSRIERECINLPHMGATHVQILSIYKDVGIFTVLAPRIERDSALICHTWELHMYKSCQYIRMWVYLLFLPHVYYA